MTLESSSDPSCNHHWIIDSANGPVSRGVCKLCQQVREFNNSIGQPRWGRPAVQQEPSKQPVDTSASD